MTDSLGTKVAITEEITNITVTNTNSIGVTLDDNTTTLVTGGTVIASCGL